MKWRLWWLRLRYRLPMIYDHDLGRVALSLRPRLPPAWVLL